MTTEKKTLSPLRNILEHWAVLKPMIEFVKTPQLNDTQWDSILNHKGSLPEQARPSIAAAIGLFRANALNDVDYKQGLKGDKKKTEKAKEIMGGKTFTKLKSLVRQYADIEAQTVTWLFKPAEKQFLHQLEMMEAYFRDVASGGFEGAGPPRELALVCLISDLHDLLGLSLEKNDTDFVRAVVAVVDPDLADTLTHNAIKKKIWEVKRAGG